MSNHPFNPPFDQLPETLPLFPLPGAIVLPGSDLPLNIFEPRYLNMVSDALSSHRMIGMIQPDPVADDEAELCHTGCAGRITQYRETSDGRLEIALRGVCRFDIKDVLPTTRGYRLGVPDWSRFSSDYADHDGELVAERDRLIENLKRYFESKGLVTDWGALEQLPTVKLVNNLSMALPFSEQDKQVLLEKVEPVERLFTFTALLGGEYPTSVSDTRH